MSAVLKRTKKLYQKVMIVELVALVSISLLILFLQPIESTISFFLGGLASFLPQCVFIYWVFFRNVAKNANKMTAFYRGEGLKWLATIVLLVVMFKGYSSLNLVLFFSGYFVFLLCNSLLPIFIKART